MTAQSHIECKFTDVSASAEARTFSGYGAIYRNIDRTGDIIAPGAFAATLREHDSAGTAPILAYQHDLTRVCGKWLEVREDERGLFVKGELARTALGDECRELLRMGALGGLSIGYQTVKADYDKSGARVLKEVRLFEISIVSCPANPKAQVVTSSVKRNELAQSIDNIRAYETMCREIFGLSRATARRLANASWPHYKAAIFGDPVEEEVSSLTQQLSEATAIAVLQAAASRIRSL